MIPNAHQTALRPWSSIEVSINGALTRTRDREIVPPAFSAISRNKIPAPIITNHTPSAGSYGNLLTMGRIILLMAQSSLRLSVCAVSEDDGRKFQSE